jgi:hypothetical protein
MVHRTSPFIVTPASARTSPSARLGNRRQPKPRDDPANPTVRHDDVRPAAEQRDRQIRLTCRIEDGAQLADRSHVDKPVSRSADLQCRCDATGARAREP